MAKILLSDLTNLQNETFATNTLNSNFEAIEDAIENTLSRDGTSPNTMGATLDMNSNRIINLPEPVGDTEPVRKDAFDDLVAATVTVAAEAAASAAAALVSENNAEAAEAATVAIFDDFDDIYLGAKAVAPALDNDGDAIATGALYFNTVDDLMYAWDGAAWDVTFNPSVSAVTSVFGRSGVVTAANGDYTASQITNVAAGNLSSITVQLAINELDTEKQPVDATLTALAGVTVAADKVIYATGADAFSTTDLPTYGRTLIANTSAADARTDLELVVGTNVQAYDAELAALAGLTSAADKVPYFTGSGTAAVADLTSAARQILDDAALTDIRTTLGVGTGDTPAFTGVTVGTSGVITAGTIELGHASNTTISSPSAGNLSVEGNPLYRVGGTTISLADGGTGASLADPNLDAIIAWDDSLGAVKFMLLADMNTEGAPAAGDYILTYGAEGDLRKVDWDDLPGAAGGIGNIVEDLTPQLGGDLDTNTFNISFDDADGITDDSGNEQLMFQKTASAVNYWEMTNSATAGPATQLIAAVGTDSDINANITSKGTGTVQANGVTVTTVGKQTIWIPATAMIPRTTNGAAQGSAEMATNKNMFRTLDFDTTTQEFAQFEVFFPKSWNLGTVTFQPVLSHASGSGNVVFGLAGVARSDDDAGDVAFGTAQTSDKTVGTANDIYVGPESSAITIAGTPAAGDTVQFQINRTVASDSLGVDARLHGIRLFYTTNAATDA